MLHSDSDVRIGTSFELGVALTDDDNGHRNIPTTQPAMKTGHVRFLSQLHIRSHTNPSAKSPPERIGARLRVCTDAKKNLFSKFLKRRTEANPAARRPRGVRGWENFERTKDYHLETKAERVPM